MNLSTENQNYINKILKDSLYLVDKNCDLYYGTRPQKLFTYLSDILPIDIKDDDVLKLSIKYNQTIVTANIDFMIKILLHSRNVIFQTNNNERFYFKTKESKILSKKQTKDE